MRKSRGAREGDAGDDTGGNASTPCGLGRVAAELLLGDAGHSWAPPGATCDTRIRGGEGAAMPTFSGSVPGGGCGQC